MIKEERKRSENRIIKAGALFQISTLILEIFAFAFLFSMSLGFVSSEGQSDQGHPSTITTAASGAAAQDAARVRYFNVKTPINIGDKTIPAGNYGFSGDTLTGAGGKQYVVDTAQLGSVNVDSYTDITSTISAADKASLAASTGGAESFSIIPGLPVWTTQHLFWGHLASGLGWGLIVLGITQTIATFLPEKQAALVKTAGIAVAGGLFVGQSVFGAFAAHAGSSAGVGGIGLGTSIGAGIVTAYLLAAYLYTQQKEKTETVSFKCYPWQAPRGGEKCNECNLDPLKPCSEYRCKSLGQSCELLNKGTGNETCYWVNRNDASSPGIKPSWDALSANYTYTNVVNRPPGDGTTPGKMTIEKSGGGCIPAYTPITFGIITTQDTEGTLEPAQCKIEYKHTAKMGDMEYYMGDTNLYITNHSQTLSLPSASSLIGDNSTEGSTSLTISESAGTYTWYIRCSDANGNENRDEFAVKFCVDEGPDLTPPEIKSTNIINGMPVKYGADNLSIEAYLNEPSECRWSRYDADYEQMENQMSCSSNVWEMNADLLYTCKTTLTAIKDRTENNFYFRCVDNSNNTMYQSYPFTLIGTQPLDIIFLSPNGTISGSTSTVSVSLHVETANGFNNGESYCYYSTTGEEKDYIQFFYNTSAMANIHDQPLDLSSGSYKYYFKCVDLGGNAAYNSTEFTLSRDEEAPIIVRAYNDNNMLSIITDENSDCHYSTSTCNFNIGEGIAMAGANETVHSTDWKTGQDYYVKCADIYNNQPNPSECSITVRPYSVQ